MLNLKSSFGIGTLAAEARIASTLVNIHAHLAIASHLVARVTDALEAALRVDALAVLAHVAAARRGTLVQIQAEGAIRRV